MKSFWDWLVRNLSNIFSFAGILLTLYFGIIYVPNWIRENQNEKIANAQQILEQSIKELIYSESTCEYQIIESLVRAKEIQLKQSYPLSRVAILTKVQESFMQDRFLPLDARKKLMAKLEALKDEIPKETQIVINDVSQRNLFSSRNYEWFSVIVSILGVIFGILSFYLKYKLEKEKQEEIDNQLIDIGEGKLNYENAIDYELTIIDIIRNFYGVEVISTSSDRDFGLDLEFIFNKKRYFVEVKYLRNNKVGLNSFQKFIAEIKGKEGEFWFIYNTDLTEMVKRKAQELTKLENDTRKIRLINAESPALFSRELVKLFSASSK